MIDPERAASFPDQASALAYTVQTYFPTSLFLSRARYTEETLEKAIEKGVKQYVILGAGMAAFAFRRPELLKHIEVFEIDHPATQAFKRQRLAELGWNPSEQLHFVPVDFTKENQDQQEQQDHKEFQGQQGHKDRQVGYPNSRTFTT
jgi:methyltransferase (TIGR00027 family)